ncbi:hypothetical protein [Paenibacillus sinopodophylli]|uniref:hypothetical protein n=1 Tax=Paenibacillus sinopodophylli TaxID=1837342 RepID=UPI00110CC294|nr:hypothetical protein [Paenibacillus sinopodophylli]
MLKITALSITLTGCILLTACAGNTSPNESRRVTNTPTNDLIQIESDKIAPEKHDHTTADQVDKAQFEPGLYIDLKSYEDQLNGQDVSALIVLENNLISLIEHDNTNYTAGFVTEKLAEAMKYYYGEKFHYRFTDIESVEPNPNNNHLHITVIGQRLDATSQTIEDVKLMYAIGQNDQSDWVIYTID